MMARKDKVVKTLTQGVAGLFKKHKIERVTGTGRLIAADTVEVSNGGDAPTLQRAPHPDRHRQRADRAARCCPSTASASSARPKR